VNAVIGIGGFRVDAVVNRVFLNASSWVFNSRYSGYSRNLTGLIIYSSSSVYNDRLFNVALKEIDSIHVMLVS
jgi:hypothetical protein